MSAITNKIKQWWGDLRREPLRTLAVWQNHRPIWLIAGITALSMEILAVGLFQTIQGYEPCELCVYIRFSMFTIFFGAMIAAINPKSLPLRIIGGYIVVGYGIVKGWIWDIQLEMQHIMLDKIDAGMDLFAAGGGAGSCSSDPTFPFGLPLNIWFPTSFQPTGVCGADGWSMFGFNMSECLFVFYGIYTALYILFIVSTIKHYKNVKKAKAES